MSEKFDLDGFVFVKYGKWSGKKNRKLKRNKKYKEGYLNLIGGSLYVYDSVNDPDPSKGFVLRECEYVERMEDLKPDFVFSLTKDDVEVLVKFADEEVYKEWKEAISKNQKKAARPPLTKERKLSRLGRMKQKTKKGVANKAVSSKVGKRAIRAKAPKEVTNLILAIKAIVLKESGSAKKADEIEESIYKIGVKSYLLLADKKVTMGELLKADKPLRVALEGFSKCYYHIVDYQKEPEKIKEKQVKQKLEEVEGLCQKAGKALTDLLSDHITARSITRIKNTISYLGNAETLWKILKDTELYDDLGELVMAGEHYSQFHFYADDNLDLPPL